MTHSELFAQLDALQQDLQRYTDALDGTPDQWATNLEAWRTPNEKHWRPQYFRFKLKKYWTEKDWNTLLKTLEQAQSFVDSVQVYGESMLCLSKADYDHQMHAVWLLRDYTRVLKGYARDYCETLARMSQLILTHAQLTD